MKISRVKFKEVMGSCVTQGTAIVTHSIEEESKLVSYLQENWFDLENADEISEVEFELDTEGDFLLDIKIVD